MSQLHPPPPPPQSQELLEAFRLHYQRYNQAVNEAVTSPTDEAVLSRLLDDLSEYTALVEEHRLVFPPEELGTLQTNLGLMLNDLQIIDPDFLRFANEHRSTTGIGHFLGLSRSTVRASLLSQGLAQPQPAPFVDEPLAGEAGDSDHGDDILDPDYAVPQALPPDIVDTAPSPASTGDISAIADWELDSLLLRLRTHFRRAGFSMLDGMLRRLGHRVPRDRIRDSLSRIDPVHRVFQRIRIRRRQYHVAGPNSLWHHDGQHGISIHNVRIERLWVDVTAQVGATWSQHFTMLELHHGLDINNVNHIWLLHHLFLPTINDQLTFFAQSWNEHRINIRDGPNRSPIDMFHFDMLVHGARGHSLAADLPEEELEVYGVDWEGLHDDALLQSQRENNSAEAGWTSWIGAGPPEHLNEVPVESPEGPFHPDDIAALETVVGPWRGLAADSDVVQMWNHALAFCRILNGPRF
ncbi:hypothetical protein B0H15DRAFT_791105 [Mycena belliarum]|uniref:Integrase core domain-containing protein n=1 Tax=Mycena belliarum TaxID=1033014 RepID=A0AAD6TVA0_9AGAR|nr:hypothetical protein B0H15DRAFT_791105 [Mycena belliae]